MSHSFDRDLSQDITDSEKVVFVDLKEMPSLPIVDIQKPSVEKVPDNPSAQGLYNSSVAKETVSRRFNKHNVPLGQPAQPSAHKQSQNQQQRPSPSTQTPQSPPSSMEDQVKALMEGNKKIENEKYVSRYGSSAPPPKFQAQIGSPQGGNTDDFLPNFQVGNRTYLNVLANPTIAYYVELFRKFKLAWNPLPVLYRQGYYVPRGGHITVIWGFTIDQNGNLAEPVLIKGSGNGPYDNEAKRTLQVSAPFTNPPPHLLNQNGVLYVGLPFIVYN